MASMPRRIGQTTSACDKGRSAHPSMQPMQPMHPGAMHMTSPLAFSSCSSDALHLRLSRRRQPYVVVAVASHAGSRSTSPGPAPSPGLAVPRHRSPSPARTSTSTQAVSSPAAPSTAPSSRQVTLPRGSHETLVMNPGHRLNPDADLALGLAEGDCLSLSILSPLDLNTHGLSSSTSGNAPPSPLHGEAGATLIPDFSLQLTSSDRERLQQAMRQHAPGQLEQLQEEHERLRQEDQLEDEQMLLEGEEVGLGLHSDGRLQFLSEELLGDEFVTLEEDESGSDGELDSLPVVAAGAESTGAAAAKLAALRRQQQQRQESGAAAGAVDALDSSSSNSSSGSLLATSLPSASPSSLAAPVPSLLSSAVLPPVLSPASAAEANSDRIRSLVTRILSKAPAPSKKVRKDMGSVDAAQSGVGSVSSASSSAASALGSTSGMSSAASSGATSAAASTLAVEGVQGRRSVSTASTASSTTSGSSSAATSGPASRGATTVKTIKASRAKAVAALAAGPAADAAAPVKAKAGKAVRGARAASATVGATAVTAGATAVTDLPWYDEVQAVLAKHALPKDVAASVVAAVASKQLPASPASIDRLLTRVMKPIPGINAKLVYAVVKQNPAVLKQSNVVLLHKWQTLKTTLSCTDTQLLSMLGATRNLMGLKAETIESKLQSLGDMLRLKPVQVSALVRRRPHLLACNADTLASKFASIQQLLQCTHGEIVRVVLEAPEVLYCSPEGMAAKVQDICTAMGITAGQVGKMASSKPRLLTSNAEALKVRWLALRKVTSSCTRWQKELAALAPSTLAGLVLASSAKVSRLEYLVAIQRPGTTALSSIMNMTQAEFSGRFHGYDKWAAARAPQEDEEEDS